MITLAWEQIEHDHACHIFRAAVPGGWLILCSENVYHGEFLLGSHTPNDLRGWDWRSSITFVPDPEHRWGSPKRPDDASTPSTASTSSHALDETADIDHLRTTLFKANKTIDKQAGQIARLKAELERFRSVIKEADIEDPDEGMVYYGRFDEDGHYQPPDRLPNIRRLEKQIARLKDELENQRRAYEPCPNCNGKGVLLYAPSFKEYQCTNCNVRYFDFRWTWTKIKELEAQLEDVSDSLAIWKNEAEIRRNGLEQLHKEIERLQTQLATSEKLQMGIDRLESQLAEAEKWKEPRLKKQQPCGCVVCTCEDPNQCQGCGAKECGQPDCVFFCGVPTSSAEWEPHPLVEERDRLLNEQKKRSNASLKQKLKRQEKTIAKLREQREDFWKTMERVQQDHLTAGNVMQVTVDEARAFVGRQALALDDAEARVTIRDNAFQALIESITAMKTDTTGAFLEALDWAHQEALRIRQSIQDPSTASTPSTKEP